MLHFDSIDCSAFDKPDRSVRPRIRFFTAGNLAKLILGNTIPGSIPKKYGVMKVRVASSLSLKEMFYGLCFAWTDLECVTA